MWLKSIFVSLYMTGAMVVAGVAGARLVTRGMDIAWLGAFLTNLPMLMMLGWLMMARVTSRTSQGLPLVTVGTIAGVAVSAFGVASHEGASLALGLAVASLVGYVIYNWWYSKLQRGDTSVLKPGRTLPAFVLENASGEEISSGQLKGQPTLLMFYRGNWCPLCMAQVKEIAAKYRELAERGVRVALVSPQPHTNTASLAERFDVPFDFLVDRDNRAAKALGIDVTGGIPVGMQVLGYDSDTVLPTVIITDASGTIIFADQTDNYRVRPEPDTFLAVLDQTLHQNATTA